MQPFTSSGRRIGAVAVIGLAIGSTAGVAAAQPATHHHQARPGYARICAESTGSGTVHFTVAGRNASLSRQLRLTANRVSCSAKSRLAPGIYTVTQTGAVKVSHIGVSPSGMQVRQSTAQRMVRIRVRSASTTTANFLNVATSTTPPPSSTPPPPADPGDGFVEVCKYAADDIGGTWVNGSVTVNVTAGTTSYTQEVPVGQCTAPLAVPAGSATVTETAFSGTSGQAEFLESAATTPSSALVSTDSTANTATVTVAPSADTSTETLVNLYNSTHLGSVKVCKTLAANAGDLVGSGNNRFAFDVSYREAGLTGFTSGGTVHVTVPTTGTAACTIDPQRFPLGTEVQVSEEGVPNTNLDSVTVSPASQAVPASGIADLVVGPNADGVTTATFTNSADGTVEICKQMDDSNWLPYWSRYLEQGTLDSTSPYDGTPFQFSINGGDPITVRAGHCSGPISVPAGTATIQELATPNFHLVGMTATGPDGSSRLTTAATANPATVTVPWGGLSYQGVGNETLVTATNQVDTGQVKICKALDPGVPVGKSYDFTFSFDVADYTFGGYSTTLTPTGTGTAGEDCNYLSHPVPVVDPSGDPSTFTVTEGPSPFGTAGNGSAIVEPTDIAYGGNGQLIASETYLDNPNDDGHYYGTATIGLGVNAMTFTNSLVLDP